MTRRVARNGCGQAEARVASESVRLSVTTTSSPTSSAPSSVHSDTRANPCAGASGASALGPNHGKQIGTPPRMAAAAVNRLCALRKRTSS